MLKGFNELSSAILIVHFACVFVRWNRANTPNLFRTTSKDIIEELFRFDLEEVNLSFTRYELAKSGLIHS